MTQKNSFAAARRLVPHKQIILLGWPLLITTLTTPLLGLVDTAVMGRMPDAKWLGAVALSTVIFNFLFWSFGSLRMSTVGLSAQALGAGDLVEQKAGLLRPFLAGLGIGGLLIIVQGPLFRTGLWLMGATGALSDLARDYAGVRIFAAPLTLANYALVGWFLGRGQTRVTLVLQVLINLVNIALSLLLVLVWGLGIKGVALATVLAEGAGFLAGVILAARTLFTLGTLAAKNDWAAILDSERLRALLQVNGDIFIRSACLTLAFGLFSALSAGLGPNTLAANTVLLQFVTLSAHILDTFAHVAEILAGQAKGARNFALFDAAVRQSSFWAAGTAVLLTLLFWLCGPAFLPVLTNLADVQDAAKAVLHWVVFSPLAGVASYQLDGIFIGTTRTKALRNAMLQSLSLYALLAVGLRYFFGNGGLWLAFTAFFIFRAVTLLRYYPTLTNNRFDKNLL